MKRHLLYAAGFLLIFACVTSLAHAEQVGMGVYYSNRFQGKATANGSTFDQEGLTAAHKTLPFGTKVKITNPLTQKSVVVTITDRMRRRNSNIIDMTRRAAREIGIEQKGRARVSMETL